MTVFTSTAVITPRRCSLGHMEQLVEASIALSILFVTSEIVCTSGRSG
jgi:hypothetical protein